MLKLSKDFQVGPTDNFFALGGQSILLLRLQAKIKRTFKTEMTLTDLLKAPTPARIYGIVSGTSIPKGVNVEEAQQESRKIDWAEETSLPNNSRYKPPYNSRNLMDVEVSEILLTGVDSFIGVHMLQTLLSVHKSTKVHIVGTQQKLEHSMLMDYLQKYSLLNERLTEETIPSRVSYVPGILAEPKFGLEDSSFRSLGQSIQAIYHLGGPISLLKIYTDL